MTTQPDKAPRRWRETKASLLAEIAGLRSRLETTELLRERADQNVVRISAQVQNVRSLGQFEAIVASLVSLAVGLVIGAWL
jgi:hypothetical protein